MVPVIIAISLTLIVLTPAFESAPKILDETTTTTVEIINEGTAPDDAEFRPDTINMEAGVKVIWKNTDASAHTVTSGTPGSPSGLFDSRIMAPDDEFEVTFKEEGVFDYYCELHPMMTGKVIIIL